MSHQNQSEGSSGEVAKDESENVNSQNLVGSEQPTDADSDVDTSHYEDTADFSKPMSGDIQTPEETKVPMHTMQTPAINKRRQATKHIVVNSPTDNIFSPISKKLLGKKRNDPARELPSFTADK